MGQEASEACCGKDHFELAQRITVEAGNWKYSESTYSSMPRGIKSQAWNSRSYDSCRGEKLFQICAENIEYVVGLIDPKKRILTDIRADQFSEEDFEAINQYMNKRGAAVLASTQEEGELAFMEPKNQQLNTIIKRDIAYMIKGIRAKKRIQNDFVRKKDSRESCSSPEDNIEQEDESLSFREYRMTEAVNSVDYGSHLASHRASMQVQMHRRKGADSPVAQEQISLSPVRGERHSAVEEGLQEMQPITLMNQKLILSQRNRLSSRNKSPLLSSSRNHTKQLQQNQSPSRSHLESQEKSQTTVINFFDLGTQGNQGTVVQDTGRNSDLPYFPEANDNQEESSMRGFASQVESVQARNTKAEARNNISFGLIDFNYNASKMSKPIESDPYRTGQDIVSESSHHSQDKRQAIVSAKDPVHVILIKDQDLVEGQESQEDFQDGESPIRGEILSSEPQQESSGENLLASRGRIFNEPLEHLPSDQVNLIETTINQDDFEEYLQAAPTESEVTSSRFTEMATETNSATDVLQQTASFKPPSSAKKSNAAKQRPAKSPNQAQVSKRVSPLPQSLGQADYDRIGMHEVIQEDVLHKYKPGMMRDSYIERWCRVTKESFKVFNGNQAFAHVSSQAVSDIPISTISHVQRVKYDIASRSQNLKGAAENQFEIILKEESAAETRIFETVTTESNHHHEPSFSNQMKMDSLAQRSLKTGALATQPLNKQLYGSETMFDDGQKDLSQMSFSREQARPPQHMTNLLLANQQNSLSKLLGQQGFTSSPVKHSSPTQNYRMPATESQEDESNQDQLLEPSSAIALSAEQQLQIESIQSLAQQSQGATLSKTTSRKLLRSLNRQHNESESQSLQSSFNESVTLNNKYDVINQLIAHGTNQNQQAVALQRNLGTRFVSEIKRHFGSDQKTISPITFAFKAALARPSEVSSMSNLNPLTKDQKNKRSVSQGWTNREIESKIAAKKLVFATTDADSCDQWVSTLTFLVIAEGMKQRETGLSLN